MTRSHVAFVLVVLVMAFGALVAARQRATQSPVTFLTRTGILVEEVKVGGSCVVVVTRSGTGPGDHVAAVPCR